MCGIAGIISQNGQIDKSALERLILTLGHRGPDDSGMWFDDEKKAALGHQRLSVIDLSSAGHQPMTYEKGRYVVTYNGEIYNYQEIKKELESLGYLFETHSDTEVLLAAYAQWKEKALDRFDGMFAFAIWDKKEKILFAARDRFGEKPFKYYSYKGDFVFASEIKALLSYPNVPREIDWGAIDTALALQFVPAPYTGFKHIYKLPAGHYLVLKRGEVSVRRYWDVLDNTARYNGTFTRAKDELWNFFTASVKRKMVSDVSFGAFLSGGVDSSSVVAAMKEISSSPLETFVISIGGESADQYYANIAASYFGTHHHEIAIDEIDYQKEIPLLASIYDEPFFDHSALPTTIISRQMKQYVTVVLGGDGSDELFGGYRQHSFAHFLKRYGHIPSWGRKTITSLLRVHASSHYKAEILSKDFFDAYVDYYAIWKHSLPKSGRYITKRDLYSNDLQSIIDRNNAAEYMRGWFSDGRAASRDIITQSMVADVRGRLADGYLTKTDLGTMASALELRTPFLDPKLAEFAFSLPSSWKVKRRVGKYIWKEAVREKLPREVLERKKVGFSIPLDVIMRGPMKEFAREMLCDSESYIAKWFRQDALQRLWGDHQKKKADYSNHIWSLIMLELWIRQYIAK